ncbi:hypothetical protein GCM10011600_21680 [Pseudolysinimonas yzui]|uniref:DUF805 domain-containing protein n=2 Tax=Pseudolysinimonas yzui TaxID=2708254 RepID=A0A8J3GRT3_9MICO|nr:hypothetical protein GCM10011600_21680 [Pseudolysinimonas yzui]
MSFGDAIVTVFRKYADFSGRATRPEFWWFALFSTIVSSALGAFNLVTPEGVIAVGSSLAGVWSIAVLVPSLAVAVRRLRDTGRSWTNLFWLLLPLAGLIVLIVFWAEPTRPEPTTTPAVA